MKVWRNTPFSRTERHSKKKGKLPRNNVSADGHKQAKLLPHRIDPWPSTVMQAMCKCSIVFVKCFNNDVIRAIDNKAIKQRKDKHIPQRANDCKITYFVGPRS